MTLNITIYVEFEASSLNLGQEKLEDILIIRLENGVDHYVCISIIQKLSTISKPYYIA